MTYLPERIGDGAFVFSVDHCFSIRGQGTILTGTILEGAVGINDVRNDNTSDKMGKYFIIQT